MNNLLKNTYVTVDSSNKYKFIPKSTVVSSLVQAGSARTKANDNMNSAISLDSLHIDFEAINPNTNPAKVDNSSSGVIDLRQQQVMQHEITLKAEEEAQKIIEKAQQYAEKVRKFSEKQANSDYEVAKSKGYEAGYEEGLEFCEKKFTDLLSELRRVIDDLDRARDEIIAKNESKIIDVAICMAEKIVNKELQEDKEIFLNLYKKSVRGLVANKWVKLTVSQYEANFATAHSDELLRMVSGAEHIDIVVSEEAECGTCIIETSETIINGSANQQFQVMSKALKSV